MGRRFIPVARSITSQVMFGVVRIAVFSFLSTVLTFFVLSRLFAPAPSIQRYPQHTQTSVQHKGAAHLWPGDVFLRGRARVSLFADDPAWVMELFVILTICIPFFYIALYTYLFARRFSCQINRPISLLVQAARKIQMRDLNFVIDYHEANEIGQLLAAFEDMRIDLKGALMRQWGLEDERREMLAAISHDLRTPITIIQGHAELLAETPGLPESAYRHTGAILRNGLRLTRLLRDFQAVTAIGSPAFTLVPVPVQLVDFINARVAEFQVTATKEVAVSCSIVEACELRSTVYLDADRVAQMMDNIQSNALRHTPEQGSIAWAFTCREDSLWVSVQDSGPGFKEADLHRVLEQFYRSEPGREGEHAGLGLYIVRELSRRHGGDVKVYNAPSGGAVVEFWIRYLAPSSPDEQ